MVPNALTIALSYIAGGLIPLTPYRFFNSVTTALIGSIVLTLAALMIFGYVKGRFTTPRPFDALADMPGGCVGGGCGVRDRETCRVNSRIEWSKRRLIMSPSERDRLLADVDAFCQEIRPIEELRYMEHQFNDQVVPLARKHDILGMLTPPELGGRGADTVGVPASPGPNRPGRDRREDVLFRPYFDRPYPILTWGTPSRSSAIFPQQPRRKIMAFGLTEPDAGSNPLEMTTTYERRATSSFSTASNTSSRTVASRTPSSSSAIPSKPSKTG